MTDRTGTVDQPTPPIRHAAAITIMMSALGIGVDKRSAVSARVRHLQRLWGSLTPDAVDVTQIQQDYKDADIGVLAYVFALIDAHMDPTTASRLVSEQYAVVRDALLLSSKPGHGDMLIIIQGSALDDMQIGSRHHKRCRQDIPPVVVTRSIADLPRSSIAIRPAAFMVEVVRLAAAEKLRRSTESEADLVDRRRRRSEATMRWLRKRQQALETE